jgi:hypothetical protein
MADKAHPLPSRDPITGGPLYISELTGEESGVIIRGRFEMPRYASLDAEQSHLLEAFIRCRGQISCMEKELGISYPTVRARLDALIEALGLTPAKDDTAKREKASDKQRKILEQLENGEITAQEAKEKLRGIK